MLATYISPKPNQNSVGVIDRPHFEIKTSWKMPTGYKLEGKLNMPTNSKGQVHLIVRQTKGEVKAVSCSTKMDKQFPGDSNCE